jgi:prepilin-type N-terminal cleavage/methylation domain-containing protein
MTTIAKYKPTRGFSLVELVMVVVIISVLAGIAGPRFASAAARARAQAAADCLASDFSLAREQARATSAPYRISFDTLADRYTLGSGADARVVDLSIEPYTCDLATVDFSGSTHVQFNAFGIPDAAGAVTITGGGVTYTLKLNALTGEVSVQ